MLADIERRIASLLGIRRTSLRDHAAVTTANSPSAAVSDFHASKSVHPAPVGVGGGGGGCSGGGGGGRVQGCWLADSGVATAVGHGDQISPHTSRGLPAAAQCGGPAALDVCSSSAVVGPLPGEPEEVSPGRSWRVSAGAGAGGAGVGGGRIEESLMWHQEQHRVGKAGVAAVMSLGVETVSVYPSA